MTDDQIKDWMPLIERGVNRYARTVPKQLKEDYKQECALEIVQAEDTILRASDELHATKIVSRIIRNTLIDIFRRKQHQIDCASLTDPRTFREADRMVAENLPPPKSGFIEQAETILQGEQRTLFGLLMDNLTVVEIAVRMGRSPRHVNNLKRKMVKKLKIHLRGKAC